MIRYVNYRDVERICKVEPGEEVGTIVLMTARNRAGIDTELNFTYLTSPNITDIQPTGAFVE